MQNRANLLTEQRLPDSIELDRMSIAEAIALMNAQDAVAVRAVAAVQSDVVHAVELVVTALSHEGRLFYVGAGSSGRLGVLDASECPPTFRTDPEKIQGIIAGGERAMFRSQEGAEDSADDGASALAEKELTDRDVVIGLAAGGTTPFVHGALRMAAARGARTIFLTCVDQIENEPTVDVVIRPLVGPEVLTGSTRLKAGTATKLVLNQISTIAMVRLGKCYENLMVDLRATNEKLWDRGARIVATLTGIERTAALELLKRADGRVKTATIMQRRSVDVVEANRLLEQASGQLRAALER
ncbi:N-acetylmuramic acid 6-phosphate etherase [soil metagenome]